MLIPPRHHQFEEILISTATVQHLLNWEFFVCQGVKQNMDARYRSKSRTNENNTAENTLKS